MSKKNWATVIEDGQGVPDGEMKVSDFVPGDILTGNLATNAIKLGWAEEGEGEPPEQLSDDEKQKAASANVEAMGAKVATAVKDKAALQKQIDDLQAQLKAADDALKTVTGEKEAEGAFAIDLLDLISQSPDLSDQLAALFKLHKRSDQLDLTPRDMAKKLTLNTDKPDNGNKSGKK